jgi:outer membrane protein OmpA-like peptidoglycan-associated protein
MDGLDDASATTRTTYQRETDTRWAHRNLGGAWWLAFAAVPLLLAALATGIKGGDIENDLSARSGSALSAAGLDGVQVAFDGRDATLSTAGAELSAADLERAKAVVAEVDGVRVVAGVGSAGAAGDPAPSSSPSAGASQTPSEDPSPSVGADCDAGTIQTQIDEIVGDDQIAFGEGSSKLQGQSAAEVDEIAALLAPCSTLAVTVSGNTDKTGSLAKSQARAEAVADALAAGGVDPAGLSATGVQADDPLGDNTTQDGRDRNRYARVTVK